MWSRGHGKQRLAEATKHVYLGGASISEACDYIIWEREYSDRTNRQKLEAVIWDYYCHYQESGYTQSGYWLGGDIDTNDY